MQEKIKFLLNQKEILQKYIKFIEEECRNLVLEYFIDGQRSTTPDDVENYKNFFDSLDKTCDSDVFKRLCSFIYQVPKTHSFWTSISADGGSTTYQYNKVTKQIMGVTSIDLPPFIRPSMDFTYLHESVHGVFWDCRKGKKFVDTPNIEVLPYFFMLYALDHLSNNYSPETINSILARFIVNPYLSATSVLNGLNNRFINFSEQELAQNFYLERYEIKDIECKKQELYLDFQQFLGPVKSIILYYYCFIGQIPFERVLSSVLDCEKRIGTELDYDYLDIEREENFNIYKNFVKQKKLVLSSKK